MTDHQPADVPIDRANYIKDLEDAFDVGYRAGAGQPKENFYDAVSTDPDMTPAQKEKWLATEHPRDAYARGHAAGVAAGAAGENEKLTAELDLARQAQEADHARATKNWELYTEARQDSDRLAALLERTAPVLRMVPWTGAPYDRAIDVVLRAIDAELAARAKAD